MPECPNCHLGAYVRWGLLGFHCTFCGVEWPDTSEPLMREPDFDFQEYRAYCETFDLKVQWAEIDFLQWLYGPGNSRA